MTNLPPTLQQFAGFLDAQPAQLQTIFQYCLAMLMVEAGEAKLVEVIPGESGALCTFETGPGQMTSLLCGKKKFLVLG